LLGAFLGYSMTNLGFAFAFLAFWELYELLFRKDVRESRANIITDLAVGIVGAIIGHWLKAFTATLF